MTRQAPQGGWNVKGGSRPLGLRSPAGCQEAFPTELRARGLVSAQAAGGTCSFLLRVSASRKCRKYRRGGVRHNIKTGATNTTAVSRGQSACGSLRAVPGPRPGAGTRWRCLHVAQKLAAPTFPAGP